LLTAPLLLVVVLIAVAGPSSRVAARQASPAADDASGAYASHRVRVSNTDRQEIAAVSAAGLVDPYEDSDEFVDPPLAPGFRYVKIDVVIEYTGTDADEYAGPEGYWFNSYDFSAVDANGVGYGAEDDVFERLDDPEAGYAAPEPGQTWGGELLFQVPLDAVLANIMYDTQTLIDLRQSRPGYGDVVPYVDIDGAELASLTVEAPTDPHVFSGDEFWVLTDERHVAFPATLRNSGDRPFAVDPRDFYVVDTYGVATREQPRGPEQNDPAGPFLQPNAQLAPGETAAGLIRFLLPDDVDPVAIVYAPYAEGVPDRWVVVAESGIPPVAPESAPIYTPPAATFTPGCEGVAEWAKRFSTALDAVPTPDEEESLPEDLSTADPAQLRGAASYARALADAVANTDPPEIARAANDAFVRLFIQAADATDALADAIESGDQARIDAAVADLEALDGSLDSEVGPVFEELAAACPEINEM
jgi:hypothetical protein